MVTNSKRDEVKRIYRRLRLDAGQLTQIEAEAKAHIAKGRYWKLENGIENPTEAERKALARAFRCDVDQIPAREAVGA